MSTRARFSHVALVVDDLPTMTSFYSTVLGFSEGMQYSSAGRKLAALMGCEPDGFDGVILRSGNFLLELLSYRTSVPAGERPRSASQPGFAHLSFGVDDVEHTVEAVREHGGSTFSRRDFEFSDSGAETPIAFALDPEGNRFELLSHPSEEEAVAHACWLGVDSIGWPAAAVNGDAV